MAVKKKSRRKWLKKSDIQIEHIYIAKISGVMTLVKINSVQLTFKNGEKTSRVTGWYATNLITRKNVIIKSQNKLRVDVTDVIANHNSSETPETNLSGGY
jgi:hypothetical protein